MILKYRDAFSLRDEIGECPNLVADIKVAIIDESPLEQLFQSMCKNGLKLSPKKCQLFRTKLTYMGNEFVINKRTMTITPLRSRTEAISKIPTPKTAKQCKSFCGVVNYLSLFCPDLQTLLKPIVELTRKGRPFVWGQE